MPTRKRPGILSRFLGAWLCVVAATTQAFAGWDARGKELSDRLAAASYADPKDREVLQHAVDDFMRARNELLTRLISIVEESSRDRVEQEREWSDRVKDVRGTLQSTMDSALHSLSKEPSVQSLSFQQMMLAEEDKFLASLQDAKVAWERDQIIKNQKNVIEMKQTLDIKWQALFDQDNKLDELEASTVKELEDLIKAAIDVAVAQNKTIKENIAAWANLGIKLGSKIPAGETTKTILKILEALNTYNEAWIKTNENVKNRIFNFKTLVESERSGIYVLFGGFRRDTQEFIDKNGFSAAKTSYQAARDKLDRWTSDLPTSGQKSDASGFESDVLAKLSNHLSATEREHNEFISRNQSKFFGPIGPDISRALAETDSWKNETSNYTNIGLDALLRQWRSATDNWWDVSLSGITDDDKQELRSRIQDRVNELVSTLSTSERTGQELLKALQDRIEQERDLK